MLSATSLLTARMIGCPTAASAWALVGVTDPAAMVAVMTGPAVGLGVASAGLKKAQIDVDRKVLADLAIFDKPAFAVLAQRAQAQLNV